ncbi:MAG: AbrB/MazE/SpoVT family DNA-binding domain-containing protein [Clostridiales bacterium]|nr:AbrB/MazE/SpoVT family DNA-binding domain-containing protein [Clostridiales bacterium]
MKSESVVRTIDSVGRIVLPRDIRERLHLNMDNSAVEIYTDDDKVILKKYTPGCMFCQNTDGVVEYKGAHICKKCLVMMLGRADA